MKNKIQPIPTTVLDINDNGLKNLAEWLARYVKLDVLAESEHSTFICDALESGSLVHFEPILKKCMGKKYSHWGADEDYEKYEFAIRVDLLSGDSPWMDLCFQFKTNNRALMFVDSNYENENECNIINNLYTTFSNILGVKIGHQEMTWLEADKIVLKYLKYKHALSVQEPPI